MRPPVDIWQGCWGHWQSAFIRENLLLLGHAAWQGYLIQGRGLVACDVEVVDATTVNWSGDVVQYSLQYIYIGAVSAYLEPHHLSADFIHRLMNMVQNYTPNRDVLIAIGGKGAIEVDWLRNLVIAPPDCHRQVCNRWDEFALGTGLNRGYDDAESYSNFRSDGASMIRICQLQQYLQRTGRILTTAHPFVKQEILKAETPPVVPVDRDGTNSTEPRGGTRP
jgi:hypothetical protein